MKYRIQRHGSLIGEYDETTLRSLLAAGAVKLSDDCVAGDSADSVAHVLFGYSEQNALGDDEKHRRWSRALVWISLMLLACLLWLSMRSLASSELAAIPVDAVSQTLSKHVPDAQPLAPVVLRNALPMTMPEVGKIIAPSLVTVIALNNEGRPLRRGSGVVMSDGFHVATTAETVSGATSVELHFADATLVKPSHALLSADCPDAVIFPVQRRGVPLAWPSDLGPQSQAEVCFLAGLTLSKDPWLEPYPPSKSVANHRGGTVLVSAFGNLVGLASWSAEGRSACSEAHALHTLLETGKTVNVGDADWPVMMESPPPIVEVGGIQETDDELSLTLRNLGKSRLSKVLLRLVFHELPEEKYRTAALEKSLRETAIAQSSLESDIARVDDGLALVMTWLKPLDVAPSEWTAAQTAQLPEASMLDGDEHNPLATAVEALRAAVSSHEVLRIEQAAIDYQHRVQQVLEALAATRRVVGDQLLKTKQKLRETTQALELTRAKGTVAVAEARRQVRKNEDELLEVDLAPGVPEVFILDAKPVSGWEAEAYVLDVE